jgi:hypothetical protein
MQGFKCNVTNTSPTAKPLAKAQVPVYCENEPERCVKGAKQMLAWHQATGNNIETKQGLTPNYNQKCGWAEGAQKDIFQDGVGTPAQSASVLSPTASLSTPSSTLLTRVTNAPSMVGNSASTTSVPAASAVVSTKASTSSKSSCKARQARYSS